MEEGWPLVYVQIQILAVAVAVLFYALSVYRREILCCRSVIKVFGPQRYPVVGSLFSFWKNGKRHIEWYAQMLANSPTQTIVVERLGGVKTVVTANPANVEYILKTRFDNYPKGEPFTAILHDLLGKGIFNADGDAWRLQRKAASHHFNSRSLRNFIVKVVEEATDRLLPILDSASERGSVLDLQDILRRFAFDTICRVAFGVDPACLEASLPVSKLAMAFDTAAKLSSERSSAPIQLVWKAKKMLNIGSESRLSEAVRVVHEFAMDVVRRRRSEISRAGDTVCNSKGQQREEDLLSRFMSLTDTNDVDGEAGCCSDEFLRDMIINFILAGRDSTSSALTWFFWLLSSHPHVEEAIYKEITDLVAARRSEDAGNMKSSAVVVFSYEELQSMNYLYAAICESMRLYPPVPLDSKHALHNDVLPDGTFVGKGTRVTYHIYAMGRMDTIWGADCLQFKPERWLNQKGDFVPQSPFKFAVFQGGMRLCLGKDMAFIQMKYVAATLISMFRLRRPVDLNARIPKLVHNLTARMEGGFPVVVERRTNPFPVIPIPA
jgi:cytochrome P450